MKKGEKTNDKEGEMDSRDIILLAVICTILLGFIMILTGWAIGG